MSDWAGKLQLRGQRIGRRLSEWEALEITQNLIGFFRTLHEWKVATLKEHRVGRSGGASALPGAAPGQKVRVLPRSFIISRGCRLDRVVIHPETTTYGPSPDGELAPEQGFEP